MCLINVLEKFNSHNLVAISIMYIIFQVLYFQGDALVTRCYYSTEDRENVTLGGFAISDEMCVNYIHYFPASSLEVCKSSISDQALQTYFRYMKEWVKSHKFFAQQIMT